MSHVAPLSNSKQDAGSPSSAAKASKDEPWLTLAAAHKVQSLIDEEQDSGLMLRVYITGGGCSGFQYGFTFEHAARPDDCVVVRVIDWPVSSAPQSGAKSQPAAASEQQEIMLDQAPLQPGQVNVSLLVDPLSLQYLKGAEIDYREDINGAQFIIRNPNAKTTCGCGSSFSA